VARQAAPRGEQWDQPLSEIRKARVPCGVEYTYVRYLCKRGSVLGRKHLRGSLCVSKGGEACRKQKLLSDPLPFLGRSQLGAMWKADVQNAAQTAWVFVFDALSL